MIRYLQVLYLLFFHMFGFSTCNRSCKRDERCHQTSSAAFLNEKACVQLAMPNSTGLTNARIVSPSSLKFKAKSKSIPGHVWDRATKAQWCLCGIRQRPAECPFRAQKDEDSCTPGPSYFATTTAVESSRKSLPNAAISSLSSWFCIPFNRILSTRFW